LKKINRKEKIMTRCNWCGRDLSVKGKYMEIFCSEECAGEHTKSIEARKEWRKVKRKSGVLLEKFRCKIEDIYDKEAYVVFKNATGAKIQRKFKNSLLKRKGFRFDTPHFIYAVFKKRGKTISKVVAQYLRPSKKFIESLDSINPDELAGFSINGRTKAKNAKRRKQNG